MGKRYLKYILHNPYTNVDKINKNYNLIEEFIEKNMLITCETLLNEIIDIERLHRKMSIEKLHPYEFLNLHYSYTNISDLIHKIKNEICLEDYFFSEKLSKNFSEFIYYYQKILDINECGKYGLLNMNGSF